MTVTAEAYVQSLREAPLCEQLRIRDLLDDVAIQLDGSFVAGFEVGGIQSYYASDEERNRTKGLLEALIRSLPERSMRMQVRFEVSEGTGDLIGRYQQECRNDSPVLQELDRHHVEAWQKRESEGFYLRHHLHLYFIWNPRIHHQSPDWQWKRKMKTRETWSVSKAKCIQRARQEHEDLLAEFNSLLSGVETTLYATGMVIRRMCHEEIFLEIKRVLNPLRNDTRPFRRPEAMVWYESARSQMVNVNVEDEQDSYLKIGGLLYSWLSFKEAPDATLPGMFRELAVMDFPLVINAEVSLPDQAKELKHYKRQLRKMLAAQRGFSGGFHLNVEAQVAEVQLVKVLQDLISSSLKTCQLSVTVAVRTSKRAENQAEREQAERILADRRERVIHAIARMNGSRGIEETLAQKRLFFSGLPAMAGPNQREHKLLTLNAADLLPLETPWRGTPQAPLMLFESPYRQLIPFSPFDSGLADANVVIVAKTGGGKTFMGQMCLLMMMRSDAQVSIIERGDSYQALVELNNGRGIQMNLDTKETLNAWDLPPGTSAPSKEKQAFLKNLVLHMIGDDPSVDSSLLDYLLGDAIVRTYERRRHSVSNPTPTFSDLRQELEHWRGREGMQQVIDASRRAAVKLAPWTGDGVYAHLFDTQTTMKLDNKWLYFNVEGLSNDPKLATAMSMLIANTVSERTGGKTGRPSILYFDELKYLLSSPSLAREIDQHFRTARKRYESVWALSQSVEEFVGTPTEPQHYGPAILRNASTKIIGQQPGDVRPLIDHLFLNPVAINEIKRFSAPKKGEHADALLVLGERAETTLTIRMVPTPMDYWICTTFPRERRYRRWFLRNRSSQSLIESYRELAQKFPQGLANVELLPEERSGELMQEAAA
jgi:TraG P-loop domain